MSMVIKNIDQKLQAVCWFGIGMIFMSVVMMSSGCFYWGCGNDQPSSEEDVCARYILDKAQRAAESVPSTSDARQACKEFIEENPYTKPWEAEDGH